MTVQYQCLVESEIQLIFKNAQLIQMFHAIPWFGLGIWCLTPLSTILLVEKSGVLCENCLAPESHWQTLSHNVVSSAPRF
jgi:hypothetical protein